MPGVDAPPTSACKAERHSNMLKVRVRAGSEVERCALVQPSRLRSRVFPSAPDFVLSSSVRRYGANVLSGRLRHGN